MPAILYDNAIFKLTANEAAPTKFIPLKQGDNIVDVVYGSGVTGTVTPRLTLDPDNTSGFSALSQLTGTGRFIVQGPGYLGFVVASLAGGTISVRATR